MKDTTPILLSQRVIQVCLFLLAAIALLGGTLQMVLGQPETTPALDNIHRFLAGIYFSMGPIAVWAALTIRRQSTLIFLLAFSAFMGGVGRLLSMSIVGLPDTRFLIYLIPELSIPFVMIAAQVLTNRTRQPADGDSIFLRN